MHSKFVSVATLYGLVGLATALPQPGRFVKRLPDGETGNGWEQQVLELHNRERSGCGQDPLVWNDELAKGSANNANQCVFRHTNDGQRSGAGENIAEGTIGFYGPDKLCQSWIDEKSGGGEDGHYTQIVWKDTTDLGCAVAECDGNNYLVCQYWPAGNFNGDNANQVCVAGKPERSSPGEHFGGANTTPNAPGGGSTSSPVSGGSPTGGSYGQPSGGNGGQPSGGNYGQPTRGRRPSGGNKKSPVKSAPKQPCPDEKKSPVNGHSRPSGKEPQHRHKHHNHDNSSPVQSSPVYGNKQVSDVNNDDDSHRRHRGHHGHFGGDDNDDSGRPSYGHNDNDDDHHHRPSHREDPTSGNGKEPCPEEGKRNRD